ncbi:arginosuccinate synthase [Leptospira langatensis]|uniref:Arginosuccinate synthase n=1 Tax=Leptospira langatensis TaxID=2484983 RepID=A0A5F1ZUM1_9LEPT|nr:ATP-binding protein [Leptospira langatensis]TGK01594.1 arginosuccinate synthase [Leptospira langatensis]TGL41956.1 arginosuccinate synthase [Leptospira langatensis]
MKEQIQTIFQTAWNKLEIYHPLMREKQAILAFSGGKDSSLLLQFYLWLLQKREIQKSPILYHLDHSIRMNTDQESEIRNFTNTLDLISVFKKKTFRNSLKELNSV